MVINYFNPTCHLSYSLVWQKTSENLSSVCGKFYNQDNLKLPTGTKPTQLRPTIKINLELRVKDKKLFYNLYITKKRETMSVGIKLFGIPL